MLLKVDGYTTRISAAAHESLHDVTKKRGAGKVGMRAESNSPPLISESRDSDDSQKKNPHQKKLTLTKLACHRAGSGTRSSA